MEDDMWPSFLGRIALVAGMALLLAGCHEDSVSFEVEREPEAAPSGAGGEIDWIFDHRHTDLDRVPETWINAAKERLRVAYGHTSHGSQIVSGMDALSWVLGPPYDFQIAWGYEPGVFFNDSGIEGAQDLGNPDRYAWSEATRRLLTRSGGCDRNVVIWSWCGQVGGTQAEIQAYLDQMAALERDFPDVRFVYMTGHLDGSGSAGDVHQRNEQIRDYCRSNGRILFDFADIESWDPDGDTYYLPLNADDGCNYDGGNWATQWLQANPGQMLATLARACDGCAHSENLNCVLKGRAFWWMAARLAGWPGE
jgi:hypothetical protein